MKVMIKRFALRHNGKTYQAGQTAELPEETAKKLVVDSPKEFALLDEENHHKEIPIPVGVNEGEIEGPVLDDMTVQELKALAEENGIDLGQAKKKQDIIAIIVAAAEEEPEQGENELPPADLSGSLK